MVQNVNPTFIKTPNWAATQITTGTGSSTIVTVYAGGVNGSKINQIIAVGNGTTAAFDLQWGVSSGGTFILYDTISIPAAAGSSNATSPVNVTAPSAMPLPFDSDGNPYLFLPSSAYSLQAKMPATSSTWTTGITVNIILPAIGDF